MGHAQRNEESVQGRTVLPPALPSRSGIAPKAIRSSAPAPRSLMPAPGLGSLSLAPAAKSQLPAADLQLAILPQWVDANAPLLPAKKRRFGVAFWIGSTGVSLVVGALVAAGLMGARLPQLAQPQPVAAVHETQAVAHEAAPAAVAASNAAAPDMEFGLDEAHANEAVAAAPVTVLVPEVTVTAGKLAFQSKQSAKRGKVSARAKSKSSGPSAARVVSTSWQAEQTEQPEPAAEADEAPEAANAAAAEAATTAVAPSAESAPAPEPVAAPEPPKPVLPEQLTREQVRQGMEAKRGAVITCAKGAYGKVLADVTIGQSGKVTSSLIDGTFAGTSVGSCMAGALRGAQFPAFSGPEIQVRYPFSF